MAAYTFTAPPPPPQHTAPLPLASHHTLAPSPHHVLTLQHPPRYALRTALHLCYCNSRHTASAPQHRTILLYHATPKQRTTCASRITPPHHVLTLQRSHYLRLGATHASAHGASPYAADAWTQTARPAVAPLSPHSTCATALAPCPRTTPHLSSVPHTPRASHLHTTSPRFSAHTLRPPHGAPALPLTPPHSRSHYLRLGATHASAHGASPYAADAWT